MEKSCKNFYYNIPQLVDIISLTTHKERYSMKKILCILICLLAFSVTAYAEKAVLKNNEENYNLKLN